MISCFLQPRKNRVQNSCRLRNASPDCIQDQKCNSGCHGHGQKCFRVCKSFRVQCCSSHFYSFLFFVSFVNFSFSLEMFLKIVSKELSISSKFFSICLNTSFIFDSFINKKSAPRPCTECRFHSLIRGCAKLTSKRTK